MSKTKQAPRPTTAAEFLAELDAATLPVATVCLRIHEMMRGTEIAAAAWAALHGIDNARDALRAHIAAQPGPVTVARWDGTKRKGE
jgi:hypothetical protein